MAEPSFQVDSFEQRLKAEKADVGLQKSENSSLAEFAAEIQRDGDQVLHVRTCLATADKMLASVSASIEQSPDRRGVIS